MRGGDLRRRITIQVRQPVPDGQGGSTPGWVNFYTCWARAQPATGVERFAFGGLEADIDWVFTIRYKTGIRPGMRVMYGSKNINVRRILDTEEKHREIVIAGTELGVA